jgi:hypothetical protein
MAAASPTTLALVALSVAACAGTSTIERPPPPVAASNVTIEAEHVRRGDAPVAVAADTDQPEGRVRASVLRQRAIVQECYERILPASPEAAGSITFTFTVEAQGLVHDATAETDTPELRPTRDCLLTHIRGTRVEGLTHALNVTWPFLFENPTLELTSSEVILTPHTRPPPIDPSVAAGAGSGALTSTEIQAVAAARLPDILGCYTTLLRTARRAEGSARFELTVAPDGNLAAVSMANVDGPIQPAAECISNILQSLHFRNTGRRTHTMIPITLRLRDTPAR